MRRLANDERELWAKVVATVKPLRRTVSSLHLPEEPSEKSKVAPAAAPKPRKPAERPQSTRPPQFDGGLDAAWDRRISRGLISPDVTIDLHGFTLARAYDALDRRLGDAIASGARVVLLITGKPPSGNRFPATRGIIRASIGDWLNASRHAGHIAAVRSAHPRHGGAGALYLILRRSRAIY